MRTHLLRRKFGTAWTVLAVAGFTLVAFSLTPLARAGHSESYVAPGAPFNRRMEPVQLRAARLASHSVGRPLGDRLLSVFGRGREVLDGRSERREHLGLPPDGRQGVVLFRQRMGRLGVQVRPAQRPGDKRLVSRGARVQYRNVRSLRTLRGVNDLRRDEDRLGSILG